MPKREFFYGAPGVLLQDGRQIANFLFRFSGDRKYTRQGWSVPYEAAINGVKLSGEVLEEDLTALETVLKKELGPGIEADFEKDGRTIMSAIREQSQPGFVPDLKLPIWNDDTGLFVGGKQLTNAPIRIEAAEHVSDDDVPQTRYIVSGKTPSGTPFKVALNDQSIVDLTAHSIIGGGFTLFSGVATLVALKKLYRQEMGNDLATAAGFSPW